MLAYIAVTNCKTAIFSATVATFLVESYKMLSPDTGQQTVVLLDRLSQQYAGFANATYVPPPAPPPSASIVCLNSIWLLSLMLSTTSALFATLTQQWARRYLQLPQMRSIPSERARVRSFLFVGTLKYRMFHAVEIAPTLLHLSVFLFNVGLVLFFFAIYKAVAIVVLLSVVLFGVAYFVLTMLPCFDHICPYRTPLSSISWYLWHALASFAEFLLQGIVRQLHNRLVPYNLGTVESWTQRKLTEWLDSIEITLNRHNRRLGDGFRGSIVNDAIQAPHAIDVKALTWLFQLPALADKSKIERFIAAIPGKTIVQLLSTPREHGNITFRDHLLALLRSCAPGIVGLDESVRSRRLSVCLDAVHHIAKAAIVPNGVLLSEYLLSDVRIHFANIGLMRALWADENPATRVTARSICALLAKHLLRKYPLEQSELAWLGDVMGKPSNTIYNQLDDLAAVDNMNVDSFVYCLLSHHTDDLPIIQATAFADTLAILMNSGSRDTFSDQLSSLILRMEYDENEDRVNVVNKICSMFPGIPSTTRQHPQASNP